MPLNIFWKNKKKSFKVSLGWDFFDCEILQIIKLSKIKYSLWIAESLNRYKAFSVIIKKKCSTLNFLYQFLNPYPFSMVFTKKVNHNNSLKFILLNCWFLLFLSIRIYQYVYFLIACHTIILMNKWEKKPTENMLYWIAFFF